MNTLDSIFSQLSKKHNSPKNFKTVKRQAILVDPLTFQPIPVVKPQTSKGSFEKINKDIKKSSEDKPVKVKKATKAPKECAEGKVRNPKTGRCVNEKSVQKPVKPKKEPKPPKECAEGKVRNPKTGRCVNEKSAAPKLRPVEKAIIKKLKEAGNKKDENYGIYSYEFLEPIKPYKLPKKTAIKPCPEGQVRNPKTGRCVLTEHQKKLLKSFRDLEKK